MNFHTSHQSSRLTLWVINLAVIMLVACSQPPNYAPVKTVNQTYEPENGDIDHKPPVTQPETRQTAPHAQANPVLRPQDKLQKAYKNTQNQIKASQNPKNIKLSKAAKPENPPKTNQANPDVNKKPPSKSQNLTKPKLKENDEKNINLIKSNTNAKEIHSAQKNYTKSLDKLEITEKNNKKSTISIDNKQVLKLNFQWPLQGRISKNFSQTDNKGILITGKNGQSVRAAESGKAVYCGQGLAGFGNLAIIKHNETFLSAYANNSKLYIKEGQKVEKGQAIGQVGLTGLKKSSLHFEIRKNGKPINPLTVLPKH